MVWEESDAASIVSWTLNLTIKAITWIEKKNILANDTSLLGVWLLYKFSAIEEMVCFRIRFVWWSIALCLIWHMSQTLESTHHTRHIKHMYHSNVESESHPIMFIFRLKTVIPKPANSILPSWKKCHRCSFPELSTTRRIKPKHCPTHPWRPTLSTVECQS